MQATLNNTAFKAADRELIDGFVNTIIGYYEKRDATQEREGRGWYRYAQDFAHDVAIETGITLKQAAYVIAALSNNVTWERQLKSSTERVRSAVNFGFGLVFPVLAYGIPGPMFSIGYEKRF